jgi:hypothetical protein
MKWIPHVGAAILLALFSVTTRLGAADKINTSLHFHQSWIFDRYLDR